MCIRDRYFILEVSDHLRQVQLETLQKKLSQDLMQRVEWLTVMPINFKGLIIGNEVLDAIPVHIVHVKDDGKYECGKMCIRDRCLPVILSSLSPNAIVSKK